VLAKAGELRTEKGLVCAVAGYPATGCGGEVKQVSVAAKAADTPVTVAPPAASTSATTAAASAPVDATARPASSSTGTTVAWVVVALVVLALIGYLLVRSRRRTGVDG
jgi:hypothetical protein